MSDEDVFPYCCFDHPIHDRKLLSKLTDICPKCGKKYNDLLENPPAFVDCGQDKYKVKKSIARGHYSLVYLCEFDTGIRIEERILKVVPFTVYENTEKDFAEECKIHSDIQEESEHIVKIERRFVSDIDFHDFNRKCHVAIMKYANGETLENYLSDSKNINPSIYAQLAKDLLRLYAELKSRGIHHNDLHSRNLLVENLSPAHNRIDVINGSVRLVAVDINSASKKGRVGNPAGGNARADDDQQAISRHIKRMVDQLERKYTNIDDIADIEFRLIERLRYISNRMAHPEFLNPLNPIDLIKRIEDEFRNDLSYSPWARNFDLSSLSECYNAQLMDSCHVYDLFVDKDDKWRSDSSRPGPLIITGMRGCGKTMLLYSMDFHARASVLNKKGALNTVANDDFIGILASCLDLSECRGDIKYKIGLLFWKYAIELIRVARHIEYIDPKKLNKSFLHELKEAIVETFGDLLPVGDDLDLTVFDKHLKQRLRFFYEGDEEYRTRLPVHIIFGKLAKVVLSMSTIFEGKNVFFLLDDASTRYMGHEEVSDLITHLIYKKPEHAFKITSELQTLMYVRPSVGGTGVAREARDYESFDLGAKVLNEVNSGIGFLDSVLEKRIKLCSKYSNLSPRQVLGNHPLAIIAENIISLGKPSEVKTANPGAKEIYWGYEALNNVCVGDVGDAIYLFDLILSRANGKLPASPRTQHDCFMHFCNQKVYSISKKDQKADILKYATAFATASSNSLYYTSTSKKLRQYAALYITPEKIDREKYSHQRELIQKIVDAGVFVMYEGDPNLRGKAKKIQTKLSFRKVFGLSHYIPLGSSDRYELNGERATKWLENPTYELLPHTDPRKRTNENIEFCKKLEAERVDPDSDDKTEQMLITSYHEEGKELFECRVKIEETEPKKHMELLVMAEGFEDRSIISTERLLERFNFDKVLIIRYEKRNRPKDQTIFKMIGEKFDKTCIHNIDYGKRSEINSVIGNSSFICDISGMTKPLIFSIIREKMNKNDFYIAYTPAKTYYPRESDLNDYLSELDNITNSEKFRKVMDKILTGDTKPYYTENLLNDSYETSDRPNVLLGFVSPRSERISHLLSNKEFSKLELLIPDKNTPRAKVAKIAADTISQDHGRARINEFEVDDPQKALEKMTQIFGETHAKGWRIEMSLTGGKIQALACAAFSAEYKVSNVWYVRPQKLDKNHYSEGAKETRFFEINLNR